VIVPPPVSRFPVALSVPLKPTVSPRALISKAFPPAVKPPPASTTLRAPKSKVHAARVTGRSFTIVHVLPVHVQHVLPQAMMSAAVHTAAAGRAAASSTSRSGRRDHLDVPAHHPHAEA